MKYPSTAPRLTTKKKVSKFKTSSVESNNYSCRAEVLKVELLS